MMISAMTQAVDEVGAFGGELTKAKFTCYPGAGDDLMAGEPFDVKFFLNPLTITTTKEVVFEEDAAVQLTAFTRYHQTRPICLSIGELWFDTYDTRKSVREEYVDKLEDLCDYNVDTHYPPVIVFHFGQFSQATKHKYAYRFFLSKLETEYSMFLSDGTPVRAKCSVCLTQCFPAEAQGEELPKQSPDHARIYTVKRGDTLQGIATFAYDDPREWRRIAMTNKIDDPMSLKPGRQLTLPPIFS